MSNSTPLTFINLQTLNLTFNTKTKKIKKENITVVAVACVPLWLAYGMLRCLVQDLMSVILWVVA